MIVAFGPVSKGGSAEDAEDEWVGLLLLLGTSSVGFEAR